MTTDSLISNYIAEHIKYRGNQIPWGNQRYLYRNLASEKYYGVLNQALLNIYCLNNNITNNVFFLTRNQVREFGARLNNPTCALTVFYKDTTIQGNMFGSIQPYWSFPLCYTTIFRDYSAVQENYLAVDSKDIAEQVISKGYANLGIPNPIDRDPSSSLDYFYKLSIMDLSDQAEPVSENRLATELCSAYLLNYCGYQMQSSQEDPVQLIRTLKEKPSHFIKSSTLAQKKINKILG